MTIASLTPYQPNEAEQILIRALRSGEYRQTTCALENPRGENCCLGVACREYLKIHPDVLSVGKDCDGFTTFDGNSGILPLAVQEWLGWFVGDGETTKIDDYGNALNLSYANDRGESFEQIADRIERGEVLHA